MKAFAQQCIGTGLNLGFSAVKAATKVNHAKALFLSRQLDKPSLDFRMLINQLEKDEPGTDVVVICCRYTGGVKDAARFGWATLRSVYHLATAKVCVLDSYWPAVSMLRQREDLTVFQIWHSLGKVKRSGKASVGQAQGRSAQLASVMKMHEGYDYVIAGAEAWNPFYRESFGVEDSQLLNIGLPRADRLVNEKSQIACRITRAYPELGEKPTVLYAPTFRRSRSGEVGAKQLAAAMDLERFNLIIKPHPNQQLDEPEGRYFTCPEFSAPDLLTVSDYLVTDYSAIALEAALIDVPTLYYVHDYEEYFQNNGLNINLFDEMPNAIFTRADDVAAMLDGDYPEADLAAYKKKFIFSTAGHSTEAIAHEIFEKGKLCHH